MFNNISYNVVVERFKAFADGHYLIRRFTHGQVDQTDLDKDQLFPWMHVAPVEVRAAAGARVFTFDVIFADIPRDKEDKTDYQKESISDCIRLAEDLLSEIQNGQVVFSDLVEVEGESTITPFIEEWTHTLSGCTLALTISVPNDYNACDIPADWSIGGGGGGTPPSPFPPLILKVNNIDNIVQNILNVVDGENTTIEDLGDGRVRINSVGGLASVTWGSITGLLSAQLDLQAALNLKADISSLGDVAFSNDYNDLDNLPTIPAAQVNSDWAASSGVAAILNKPTIPSPQVNSDWSATSGIAQILNKPTIPAAQVNADWNSTSGLSQILNKPSIPAAQVNADWNSSSGLSQILNKPTIPAAQIQADWNQTNTSALDFIKNKPTAPGAQVNSDWNATSGVAEILNKPTIPAAQVNSDWNATSGLAQILNKPTIPAAQVNSDWNAVSGLAQILNKPSIPAAQIQSDWTQTNIAALDYIKNKPTLPGTIGDMLKSVYDTDNDGIVDFAEALKTEVRNSTGATLPKGHIIRLSGSTGNLPNAVYAQANNDANSAQTFGVVQADIPNNSNGYVVTLGQIADLDTRSTAPNAFTSDTLVDGDVIYLSPTTPGHITNVKPFAPQHIVYVGMVVRTSPTNGTIQYRIQNGYELDELHNVVATAPVANDYLYYDASTSLYRLRQLTAARITDANLVGQNLVKLTNPNAISFIRVNADNTVTARTPAQVVTDLGISANLILNRNFADTSLSGTTTNTVIYTVLIPANTLQANDWINLRTFVRTNTAGTNVAVYLNTAPAIPTSAIVTIATLTLTLNTGGLFERNFMITSIGATGSVKYFQGPALSAFTPANNAAASGTINTTVDLYLVFAAAPSAGATFITNGNLITLTR